MLASIRDVHRTGSWRTIPCPARRRQVNTAHARQRGPGAELKNWKVLRMIRSSPNRADELILAGRTLMIAGVW